MCEACLEDARRNVLTSRSLFDRHGLAAPTTAELERHARRFGPEGVAELARQLGVDVRVERPASTRKRAKGPTLKQRVAAHVAEGRGVELIAEIENLSPSRARRLIEEVNCG